MRKPSARRATSEPIRPRPRMPRTLPKSSTPWSRLFSQRPALSVRSAAGRRRAIARRSPRVCSATAVVFPPGVFMTITPRSVAASTSIESTPAPARPMTSRRRPASITARVTLVALRTMSPSYSPTRPASSRSPSEPATSTSRPCLRSASTPMVCRPSVTRTRFTTSRRRSSAPRGRSSRSRRAARDRRVPARAPPAPRWCRTRRRTPCAPGGTACPSSPLARPRS